MIWPVRVIWPVMQLWMSDKLYSSKLDQWIIIQKRKEILKENQNKFIKTFIFGFVFVFPNSTLYACVCGHVCRMDGFRSRFALGVWLVFEFEFEFETELVSYFLCIAPCSMACVSALNLWYMRRGTLCGFRRGVLCGHQTIDPVIIARQAQHCVNGPLMVEAQRVHFGRHGHCD